MRLFILGMVVAASGCAAFETSPANAPPPETGEDRLIRLMQPVRARMDPVDFDSNYRNMLLEFVHVPVSTSADAIGRGTLALLKSPGWFCGHGVRNGGVAGPSDLGEGLKALKIVGFDGAGQPVFQVARIPWTRFAIIDADGDPATLELVRWTERCEYRDPPFLAIHRLDNLSLSPMLVLTLNPDAGTGSRVICEERTDKEGKTSFHVREKYDPDRTGRWRLERNGKARNDVIVEEKVNGVFKVVARFVLRDDRSEWVGPQGGDKDFWIRHDDPWVGAGCVRFAELPMDGRFQGGNYGSLRRDVDHLKAAREAAREAGLTR